MELAPAWIPFGSRTWSPPTGACWGALGGEQPESELARWLYGRAPFCPLAHDDVTVWNVLDEHGRGIGQAASYAHTTPC